MAASKEQILALKKKLEEVQKAKVQAEKAKEESEQAREEAEQQGYDIGVAENEEALRVKVSRVCRLIASRYGMRLSTKPSLRLLLCSGRQRVSTTLQPFVPPPPVAPS